MSFKVCLVATTVAIALVLTPAPTILAESEVLTCHEATKQSRHLAHVEGLIVARCLARCHGPCYDDFEGLCTDDSTTLVEIQRRRREISTWLKENCRWI